MVAILRALDLRLLAVAGATLVVGLVAAPSLGLPTLGLDCNRPLQVVDTETRVGYRLRVEADWAAFTEPVVVQAGPQVKALRVRAKSARPSAAIHLLAVALLATPELQTAVTAAEVTSIAQALTVVSSFVISINNGTLFQVWRSRFSHC